MDNRENKYSVVGENEGKGLCPCCRYYSIGFGEEGFYDICPVCFWENGGDDPNHITLEEAQKKLKYLVLWINLF
ncbi:CPCC family cysteine-rich protein [Flammeovirga sp. OC4]|uniref:CPCC family cysteine-rich protein n=1 Tax=Flammeovirga sp. OC4 TaxID=1382345 RepID=UPI000694B74E|nr:CPCC family cysteine-rich protein [Flammeovirga sp. OC4]